MVSSAEQVLVSGNSHCLALPDPPPKRAEGESGYSTQHSRREENVLWFNGISLNQSESSWAVQNSRARENSDWTDSLASGLNLLCSDRRSRQQ